MHELLHWYTNHFSLSLTKANVNGAKILCATEMGAFGGNPITVFKPTSL